MHVPVLKKEVLQYMAPRPGGRYIDATVGSGGHAVALLESSSPDGRLLGIDRDAEALERAHHTLRPFTGRFVLVHGNFAEIAALAPPHGFRAVDGVLMDLGVSSEQLDTPERGFSFQFEGPLDMRMDRRELVTAETWVNESSEPELRRLLREYGEVGPAARVARAIIRARQSGRIRTTTQLARIVEQSLGGRRGPHHPATQVFLALRLAVNRELEALARALPAALNLLLPGGRLVVISFHSLEDRVVKQFARAHAGRWTQGPRGVRQWEGEAPPVEILTRKPVVPSAEERRLNPRCRSARLRAIARRSEPVGTARMESAKESP